MILFDLPPGTTLFRAHTPPWASRPTSGAGAATRGGRFNREGVEALYLSLDEVTALREYQQTSPFLPPCTICSYTVALRDLVEPAPASPRGALGRAMARLARGLAPPEVRAAYRTPHLGSRRSGAGPWLRRHPLSEPGARGRNQRRGVFKPAQGRQLGHRQRPRRATPSRPVQLGAMISLRLPVPGSL